LGRSSGKTPAKAPHEQVRARERRRGERHEHDKGHERDDQDGDHGESRDDQDEDHRLQDDDAGHPFDCVAHAIERPAAPALSLGLTTSGTLREVIGRFLSV
jgi:hypothetical protein